MQAPTPSRDDLLPLTAAPSWAEYALLLVAAAAVYLPFAGIPYFADDYYYLFENPRTAIFDYFLHYHDVGGIFRPFQMAWCAINQCLFGENTWMLQAVQILMHGLLACAIYRFMLTEGLPRRPSFIATLLFVLNPTCVSAVLGNDTISQVGSTLFGFASFALAWRWGRTRGDGRRAAQILITLALALLFKETGFSFALIVPLTLIYWLRRHGRAALPTFTMLLVGCIAVTVVYLLYRRQLAPTRVNFGGAGGYGFHLGRNILTNQASFFTAALLPASTVDLFVAYYRRSIPALAGIAALGSTWAVLLLAGATSIRKWPALLGLLVLASLATVPVTLMNHVSELYTYNMVPFLCIAIAVALVGLRSLATKPVTRRVIVAALLLVAISDTLAIMRKSLLMQANGRAAAQLMPQAIEQTRQLPHNGTLLLVERPHPSRCLYSIFLTTDFQGLLVAERWIRHRSERPDVNIRVVTEAEIELADIRLMRVESKAGPRLIPWQPAR